MFTVHYAEGHSGEQEAHRDPEPEQGQEAVKQSFPNSGTGQDKRVLSQSFLS